MISFYIKKVSVIVLCLLLITGCEPQDKMMEKYVSPLCIKSQDTCSIVNESGEFLLMFDVEKVVSESPFHYYLTYKGKYELIAAQGYLEGKNMYMGKIPVFFENIEENNQMKGGGLLGSCSEDVMTWDLHLLLTLKSRDTQQEVIQKIQFSYSSQRF